VGRKGHRGSEPETPSARPAGPQRTCVGCRDKGGSDELIRLVRHPVQGIVVVDLPGKLPGRGAWIHPRAACVTPLTKKAGRLGHALGGPVETKDLAEVIQEALHRAALDGVSMAAASGSLVGGHDKLVSEILAGAVRQVVLADDASPRTVQSLRTAADRAREEAEEAGERVHDVIFVTLPIGREALGTRTGRGARAALGVRPTRGSAFLRRQLRRLRDLG